MNETAALNIGLDLAASASKPDMLTEIRDLLTVAVRRGDITGYQTISDVTPEMRIGRLESDNEMVWYCIGALAALLLFMFLVHR